jgi:chromate reductase, NAD(P)H dehydrogenase (quinone)
VRELAGGCRDRASTSTEEERDMDNDGVKIVGLAGSLRRASFHRGLIRAARELAPEDVTVEPYEQLDEIPFFNQDVENLGNPAPVMRFKERINQAHAVLIATPEYDYAIPGVLTNALDWALRPPSPFRHKPVGIVGASPSYVGTARGQMVLRQILLHPPAYVMPEPQMLIPFALERFDEQTGDLVDERTREMMNRFLKALVEWTERFKITLTAY